MGVLTATQIVNPTVTTSYTVTVTGTNGCTATDVVDVNVNTVPPTVDAGMDMNMDCTITSATIGTTAIAGNTYSWSNGVLTATQIVNPTVTTSYTVTVTGTNGCTATDVVDVNVNTVPPTVDAGIDMNMDCTITSATIGTTAIAGNTYSWSNGVLTATQIVNPTVTTSYTVTVTGANGCTAMDIVDVNVNTVPPTVDAGIDMNIDCTTTSATIGTTAIAGNTYSWSNGVLTATQIVNPTVTTSYTVTVTGTNGCTATDVVDVNVNTVPPTVDAGIDMNMDCTITSATIGTTAIAGNTYSWSNGVLTATQIVNPTVTTSYTVTVTGTNGCTATDVVDVNVNTVPPTVDAGIDMNMDCTITSATIGTTAIAGNTYSWSNGILTATQIVNPTVTTSYTVTVTGTNGCTATDVVDVNVNTVPPTVDAGIDMNMDCTITSATIGTTAIAGNTYSWSNGVLTATQIVNPTVTTSYTVTVTGTNGCTATDVVDVNVNTVPPTVDAGIDMNMDCTITSATIGTTAIAGNTYSWSNGVLTATQIVNPTVTTSYTVTVTGTNGCTATDVVDVNVNTVPPTVDAGIDMNMDCTITSATIGTTAIAGNTYSWSNGVLTATQIVNPTVTTSYTVTVTGTNGCTATDVVDVNVNSVPPTVDAGIDMNTDCTITSATIGTTAIAGNTYSWSNGVLTATQIVNPTVTTSYTVTVTGANGCTAMDIVDVNVNTVPPTVDAGIDMNIDCTTTSATIGTTAIAGNTYSWSNGVLTATQIVNPTVTTSYTVTVTGTNGCTATDVVDVNVNTIPPVVTITGTMGRM